MLWPDTLAKEKKLCTTNQARERMTIKSTRFRIHFCSIACSFMGLLSTPSLWGNAAIFTPIRIAQILKKVSPEEHRFYSYFAALTLAALPTRSRR